MKGIFIHELDMKIDLIEQESGIFVSDPISIPENSHYTFEMLKDGLMTGIKIKRTPSVLPLMTLQEIKEKYITSDWDHFCICHVGRNKIVITIAKNDDDVRRYVIQHTESSTSPNYWLWGVEIDQNNPNPATCITLLDDLLEGPITTFGEKPCLFKNGEVQYYLNPNNFNEKEDGSPSDITTGNDGDVMIEIPKMAYFIDTLGNKNIIKLTDHPDALSLDSRFRYYGHARGDGSIIKDKLYYGAYPTDENMTSLKKWVDDSWTAPRSTYRAKAKAKGAGYDIISFYPILLTQIMYLMKYCNLDSQTVLGHDRANFAGIEDWYGNCLQIFDGACINENWNLLTAFDSFNDTGAGYINRGKLATGPIEDQYLKKIFGTTEAGFLGSEYGGSATTYFCDSHKYNGGKHPMDNTYANALFGGAGYYHGSPAGAFHMSFSTMVMGGYSEVYTRLMFL